MVHIDVQTILIIALAAYYVTLVIQETDGPFDVFMRLRKAVGIHTWGLIHLDEETAEWVQLDIAEISEDEVELVETRHSDTFLSKMLFCHRCMSIYSAIAVYILHLTIPQACPLLAIAGAAVVVREVTDGL